MRKYNFLQFDYALLARSDINFIDKFVISYVLSWTNKGLKCHATNEKLAETIATTPEAIQDSIDRLTDKDIYIIEDGNKRYLHCYNSHERSIKQQVFDMFTAQNTVTPTHFLKFVKHLEQIENREMTAERVNEYLIELKKLSSCNVDGLEFCHPSIADEIIAYSLMGNYSQFYPLKPERFNELKERFALTLLNEEQLGDLANDIKQDISNRYGEIFDIEDINKYFNNNLKKLLNTHQMKNLLADRVFETLEKHKKVSV